jgi:hypothetical protein
MAEWPQNDKTTERLNGGMAGLYLPTTFMVYAGGHIRTTTLNLLTG